MNLTSSPFTGGGQKNLLHRLTERIHGQNRTGDVFRRQVGIEVAERIAFPASQRTHFHQIGESFVFQMHLFQRGRHFDRAVETHVLRDFFVRTLFQHHLRERAISDFFAVRQVVNITGNRRKTVVDRMRACKTGIFEAQTRQQRVGLNDGFHCGRDQFCSTAV
jgi:hypothetical protein